MPSTQTSPHALARTVSGIRQGAAALCLDASQCPDLTKRRRVSCPGSADSSAGSKLRNSRQCLDPATRGMPHHTELWWERLQARHVGGHRQQLPGSAVVWWRFAHDFKQHIRTADVGIQTVIALLVGLRAVPRGLRSKLTIEGLT